MIFGARAVPATFIYEEAYTFEIPNVNELIFLKENDIPSRYQILNSKIRNEF